MASGARSRFGAPCSNLRSFGSIGYVLYWRQYLWYCWDFSASSTVIWRPHSDSAPGKYFPLSLRPCLLVLTGDHWQTCEHPRQDPFQRSPLLYKDPYSTHHIDYGNTKGVLYIRKVNYMNIILPNCNIACLCTHGFWVSNEILQTLCFRPNYR